jgi:hypothetical protein
MTEPSLISTQWTDESIYDLIRKLRNDLIKDFLDERHLRVYVANKFNVREISANNLESIRNSLKDLLISPVNAHHYEVLINKIRESDSASLSEGNEQLFYNEIESILKGYIY